MDSKLRKIIYKRSSGRCEEGKCYSTATEIHHRLTKARGGVILDNVYETYHLLHLCRSCHLESDGQTAYDRGLLIRGYVMTNLDKTPFYVGPDEFLSEKYGKEEYLSNNEFPN